MQYRRGKRAVATSDVVAIEAVPLRGAVQCSRVSEGSTTREVVAKHRLPDRRCGMSNHRVIHDKLRYCRRSG